MKKELPIAVYKEILFKRKDISVWGFDAGHWWIEMYSDLKDYKPENLVESYGWYPFIDKNGDGRPDVDGVDKAGRTKYVAPSLYGATAGVPGRLNRTFKMDPHGDPQDPIGVDWNLDFLFYAVVVDGRSLEDVKTCIRGFALGRSAEWSYPSHKGADSCQTFQEKIIAHCKIYLKRMSLGSFADVEIDKSIIKNGDRR